MGTIAQEISRIQGAKSDLATSIANKGVTVPAATKIDGYAALVDQIQQGGGTENEFLTETDLTYMFDYRNSSDDKIVAGINRMKNNQITNLDHCFFHFNDERGVPKPAETNLVVSYIQYMLRNNLNCVKDSMMSYYSWNYNITSDLIIDLTGISLQNSMQNFLNYAGLTNWTANTGRLIFKCSKNTFKNVSTLSHFGDQAKNRIRIQLMDGELAINCGCQSLFSNSKIEFLDANGDQTKELTLDFDGITNNTDLGSAFYSMSALERLHFKNLNKCTSFLNMLSNNFTTIKSVDGLKFSNVNYNTYCNLFNTSGSSYFTELGELGIVNGSTLSKTNNVNLNLTRIWNADTSTVRDGQTIGYWYEKFANALGNKEATGTQTITLNANLYNSLTETQKALITDKGYLLASGA